MHACVCVHMFTIQESDPKYLAPELMQGHFGKSADIFRYGNRVVFHDIILRYVCGLGTSLLGLACEIKLLSTASTSLWLST